MQKHVNLVDLVKSFPTNIFLQKLASIQRTGPIKFAHLAEKSENGSISNLSPKVWEGDFGAVVRIGRLAIDWTDCQCLNGQSMEALTSIDGTSWETYANIGGFATNNSVVATTEREREAVTWARDKK